MIARLVAAVAAELGRLFWPPAMLYPLDGPPIPIRPARAHRKPRPSIAGARAAILLAYHQADAPARSVLLAYGWKAYT